MSEANQSAQSKDPWQRVQPPAQQGVSTVLQFRATLTEPITLNYAHLTNCTKSAEAHCSDSPASFPWLHCC
jgi:hypothetical protein